MEGQRGWWGVPASKKRQKKEVFRVCSELGLGGAGDVILGQCTYRNILVFQGDETSLRTSLHVHCALEARPVL
jgi:hypothetical protein